MCDLCFFKCFQNDSSIKTILIISVVQKHKRCMYMSVFEALLYKIGSLYDWPIFYSCMQTFTEKQYSKIQAVI